MSPELQAKMATLVKVASTGVLKMKLVELMGADIRLAPLFVATQEELEKRIGEAAVDAILNANRNLN